MTSQKPLYRLAFLVACLLPLPILYVFERARFMEGDCVPFGYLAVAAGLTSGLGFWHFASRKQEAFWRGLIYAGFAGVIVFVAWREVLSVFLNLTIAIMPIRLDGPCARLLVVGVPLSTFVAMPSAFLLAFCVRLYRPRLAVPPMPEMSPRVPASKSAPNFSLGAGLHEVLVASNFLATVLLVLSGYAYSTRGRFYGSWSKSPWQLLLNLLPYPDVVTHLLLRRLYFQYNFQHSGFLFYALAALIATLTIALAFAWRWAYLLELLVCFAAIANRVLILGDLLNSRFVILLGYSRFAQGLYFLGLVPCVVFSIYSYRRFVHPVAARVAKLSTAANLGEGAASRGCATEMLAGALFSSASALFFYGVYVSLLAAQMDYWPKRYLLIHALLVAIAYVAVMVCAAVPRFRFHAGAIGVGLAVAGIFSLNPQGTLNPILVVLGPLFTIGLSEIGSSLTLFVVGFVLSNFVLFVVSVRRAKWTSAQTFAVILASAFYFAATGPVTTALQSHESSIAQTTRAQAQGVPARMYGIQACLVRYAGANSSGSYPASLRSVNSAVPGCLDAKLVAGDTIDGFRYRFSLAAGGDPIRHFQLKADSIYSEGNLHIAYFSDESFILRKTDQAGVPASQGRGYFTSLQFGLYLGGIRNYSMLVRRRDAWAKNHSAAPPAVLDSSALHYPDTLADAESLFRNPRASPPPAANSISDNAYTYRYQKILGPPENFHLSVRPNQYGVTGVLSYYLDDAGIVHSTPEDRAATAEDPPASPCSYDLYTSGCATPPSTGPVDLAKLFPSGTLNPHQAAFHPGGLATDSTPVVFWRVNDNLPKFLGVSDDSQFLFAVNLLTGISALRTSDASPVWTLPGGAAGAVGPGAFYALDGDGLLARIDPAGRILWRFSVVGAKSVIRAANGTLFVPGIYLCAVNDEGEQLWRMHIPDGGEVSLALSTDQKALYARGKSSLYAIDADRGILRWTWNASAGAALDYEPVPPQAMPDGSVAVETFAVGPNKWGVRGAIYQIHVIGADGKERWSVPQSVLTSYPMQFAAIPGTPLLAVRDGNFLEIFDSRGTKVRTQTGNWVGLAVTRRPTLYFTCSLEGLTAFGADGREALNLPEASLAGTVCGPVHSGPGKLLFVETTDSPHERGALWSFQYP